MDWFAAPDHEMARLVLQRGVGLIYLVAFAGVVDQFRPLLGERGLLPVPQFLGATTFREAPSLFHWRFSDRWVAAVGWAGVALSALVVAGVVAAMPLWASMAVWLVLWGLYLSIVNVGQVFYGFGWESLLLEAGFYAAFLGTGDVATPRPTVVMFLWLLFRVEFGAGLIKLRGDPCWRDLTCLEYHHETQPMPNPASRWFHHLPRPLHRIEVLANHLAQLVAPLGLFLPQPVAGGAAVLMIVTQGYLLVSGNYAWLNLLTLVLGFAAIPDGWYGPLAPAGAGAAPAGPLWFQIATTALLAVVLVLSYWPIRNMLGGRQLMNFSFNRYHLVNTYGAFGSITRSRREVVIEGARSVPDGPTRWAAYEFRAKPGDPRRRPPQYAPYHLRLDWLMWFVALSPSYGRGWLETLLVRLLQGDHDTLRLLRREPFADGPPDAVRVGLVDYRFSTRSERRRSGAFWVTGARRELVAPVVLDGGRLVDADI
jgi:hypothetical protein